MKSRLCCAVISLAFVVMMIGCSGKMQDKPLPMTQDNLQEYAEKLEKELNSVDLNAPRNARLIIGAYKTAMEKKMKFSFDKTFRNVYLFHMSEALSQLMRPAIGLIIEDTKDALDQGFISQRTFDILDMGKKTTRFTKEREEFLGFVVECQNQNQGVCNSKALLNVLSAHNVITADQASADKSEFLKLARIDSQLDSKYELHSIGSDKLITKPDGTDLNTNGLMSSYQPVDFIVNQSQIDLAKKYTQILAEEEVALSK